MNKKSHLKYDISDLVKDSSYIKNDEWKIIQKLSLPEIYNERSLDELKRGVVIDVESTGLAIGYDDIIQIALLPFE